MRNLRAPHRTLPGTRGDRARSAWFLALALSLANLGVCAHPISVSDGTLDVSEHEVALQAPRQRLNLMTARVGLILTCPTVGAFRQIEVNWDLFTQHVRSVRSTLFTDDQAVPVVFSINRPHLPTRSRIPSSIGDTSLAGGRIPCGGDGSTNEHGVHLVGDVPDGEPRG